MYNYTTTSAYNSSSSSIIYTTTSTYSPKNEEYSFSVTSDSSEFLKKKKRQKSKKCKENESEEYHSCDLTPNKFTYTTTSSYIERLNDTIDSLSSTSIENTSQTKECLICVETYNIKQFEKITDNCSHSNDICKKCVGQHIETQLNTKGDVQGILCPFGNKCGALIEHNDVQRIVNSDLFKRYDDLSLNQTLSNMPDFRWCKNSGCGSGQIHSGGETEPIMTCKACGERSCYTHDIPWHDSLSCEDYDEARKGEDEATQDLLDRETKQCPKCGVRITKNGGCNHMTCRVQSCRYEFCWLCLADFDQIRINGNHFHKTTCQLYA